MNARTAILDFLAAQGPMTIDELSDVIGLSTTQIRRDVDALCADKTLVIFGTRADDRRGPKRWVYGLPAQCQSEYLTRRVADLEARVGRIEAALRAAVSDGK